MKVATQAETVSVTAEPTPVINTEASNIAETKTSLELIELPAALTARSTGSTSALTTLTMQPGVQTDASGNISVVGGKPAMLSTSIDGISNMAPRSSAPRAELFPSNDSIAEIRVSEVNNSAEFSGVSDITTILKSGNNSYHGGLFERRLQQFQGADGGADQAHAAWPDVPESYMFVRNLTNAQGYNPSSFASEAGGIVTDLRNRTIDYGNVAFLRRHRFLSTFLYQLPGPKTGILGQTVGGWQMGGVLVFQSEPFMTVTVPSADPMGNNFPNLIGNGRADLVGGVPLLAARKSVTGWINKAAFAVPPSLVGRYPTSPVGNVVGPGTEVLSMSLTKSVRIREGMHFEVGAQAGNIFNHQNWATPNTTFNTAAFGTISNVQTAENVGPRQIQITSRLTF